MVCGQQPWTQMWATHGQCMRYDLWIWVVRPPTASGLEPEVQQTPKQAGDAQLNRDWIPNTTTTAQLQQRHQNYAQYWLLGRWRENK